MSPSPIVLSARRRRTQTQFMPSTASVVVWIQDAELGAILRAARVRRRLTCAHLVARGLYLDRGSLAKVERGEKAIEWQVLTRAASLLNAPDVLRYAEGLIAAALAPDGWAS